MLKILPIQTKEEQKEIMAQCSIPFRAYCFAYAAYDDGILIGGVQFYFENAACHIVDIRTKEGVDDEEALFIMGRGVLNIVDMCGIHDAYVEDPERLDKKLIARIGFWKNDEGKEYMNLRGFFTGHKH